MTTRSELETLTRDGLIERARRLGVPRPEVMTRVEMTDEIIRRQETDVAARRRARGWLGVARDLVASLIEQGLNMPDTAELLRQGGLTTTRAAQQPPVATVTLAEIYAAQGHLKRALGMLDEVLDKEPDHAAARALRDRLGRDANRPLPVRPAEPSPLEEPSDEGLADAEADTDAAAPVPDLAVEAQPPPASVEATPLQTAPVEAEPLQTAPVEAEPLQTAPVDAPAPAAQVEPVAAPTGAEPRVEGAPALEVRARPLSDVLLVIPGARGVFVYWELSDKGRAAVQGPDRRLVVRLSVVAPSLAGARKSQRDLPLEAPAGSLLVHGLGADSVVRGALGLERGGVFSPLLVASVLGGDADDPAGEVAFSPFGAERVDGKLVERARAEYARA